MVLLTCQFHLIRPGVLPILVLILIHPNPNWSLTSPSRIGPKTTRTLVVGLPQSVVSPAAPPQGWTGGSRPRSRSSSSSRPSSPEGPPTSPSGCGRAPGSPLRGHRTPSDIHMYSRISCMFYCHRWFLKKYYGFCWAKCFVLKLFRFHQKRFLTPLPNIKPVSISVNIQGHSRYIFGTKIILGKSLFIDQSIFPPGTSRPPNMKNAIICNHVSIWYLNF